MAGLRVIAGKAKGRRLKLVPGEGTRPVSDRVKEALFNIIGLDIEGAIFMDLFAGTGSVGIEALSRGAAECLFLDNDRGAVRTIHDNLTTCGFENLARVLKTDSFIHLKSTPTHGYDYIYIAPPQYQELWIKALSLVDQSIEWVNPDGWVIVQIDPKEAQVLDLDHLVEFDRRKYGNTLLVFYEYPGQ